MNRIVVTSKVGTMGVPLLILVLVVLVCQQAFVAGQRTAETGEFRTRNEPRDTGTQDCSNRIQQLETIIQSFHDDVNSLKENRNTLGMRIDDNDWNGYGECCPAPRYNSALTFI